MPEKVLIVDDDPEMINLFRLMLQNQGYQVVVARDGMQALELAHKELPDLIILDIMLPGVDGFEVAHSLNRTPDTALIPILMVTARSAEQDKLHGYAVGADIFLTKPVQPLDLQANIKVLLMQRKAKKTEPSERGYVIGVMAAKGGQGASTLALNLAVSYAKKYNEKVIAAEMRPGQGTWADELKLSGCGGITPLLQMSPAEIDPAVIEQQLTTLDPRIRLLPASTCADEPLPTSQPGTYEAVIDTLSGMASLVVLDIGTFSSQAVADILDQCSEVMVVTEPQPVPVRLAARLLERLRVHGVGSSRRLSLITLNHTRADMTMNVTQIEEALKRPVALGLPPALELAAHAARLGVPLVNAQPDNLTVQQFNRLAETVKKHRETT